MKKEPEENKPKLPECSHCHSRGHDIRIEKGVCWVCRTTEKPEDFGLPANVSMVDELKRKRKYVSKEPKKKNLPDPEKDRFKDAFQKEDDSFLMLSSQSGNGGEV